MYLFPMWDPSVEFCFSIKVKLNMVNIQGKLLMIAKSCWWLGARTSPTALLGFSHVKGADISLTQFCLPIERERKVPLA